MQHDYVTNVTAEVFGDLGDYCNAWSGNKAQRHVINMRWRHEIEA
jgi:hypothetical protein